MASGSRTPWFTPPRLLTTGEAGERRASWLELFFDLVFVVAITEPAHELVLDHSAGGFLRFAALFVPVWVAWQGYMAYTTRFDTDDLPFRVAYFAAMLAIAAMAVLVDDVTTARTARSSRSRTSSCGRSCSRSTRARGAPCRRPGR
jgi:low temperature requirement protein LtrA